MQTREKNFSLSFYLIVIFQTCKPHKRSVCGSNGKTYRNHCELHRDACLTGLKIQVAHDGHCQGTRCENLSTALEAELKPPFGSHRVTLQTDFFVTNLPFKVLFF